MWAEGWQISFSCGEVMNMSLSGKQKSLDDDRRFCVFAAFRVLKGIESIEDWMKAN